MVDKILFIIILVLLVYINVVRPWILTMGATEQEVAAAMAGDGLVTAPNLAYTQAVTIHAPRELVWSYLVQVGYRRAGWYNWDFINRMSDRKYFYEGNRSADRIIPELQHLQAGEMIYLTPQLGMAAEVVQPGQALVLTGREEGHYLVAWSFGLQELDHDYTRLLVRWTSNLGAGLGLKISNLLVVEPGGAGIQQSQMLKGIKVRAERDYQATRNKP